MPEPPERTLRPTRGFVVPAGMTELTSLTMPFQPSMRAQVEHSTILPDGVAPADRGEPRPAWPKPELTELASQPKYPLQEPEQSNTGRYGCGVVPIFIASPNQNGSDDTGSVAYKRVITRSTSPIFFSVSPKRLV